MTTTTHYVRQPYQRLTLGKLTHAVEEGDIESLCGSFTTAWLERDTSSRPPTCPACAKALEGGQ